jgi:hypothetical protein
VDTAFHALDVNKDGTICRDDFHAALEHLKDDELKPFLSNVTGAVKESTQASTKGALITRTLTTAEVTVSKIFPAGFGWQTASAVAATAGLEGTEVGFFVMTGAGDMLGVGLGHSLYYYAKSLLGYKVDMEKEVNNGIFLGTAAFFSGFAWQPIFNFLTLHGFQTTMVGTGMGCGFMFFVGLRFARAIYAGRLRGIWHSNHANLKDDVGLSLAVGGATGMFVGTDVSFGAENYLAPIVGIPETASTVGSAAIAGSSTALGFVGVQAVQNTVVPAGKNWLD